MKNKNFIIGLLLLCLISCKNSFEIDNIKILPIDVKTSKMQDFNSMKIDRFIVLETTENALIEDISNISILDDYLLVYDGRCIYLFGMSGNFMRQIGEQGHGPDEYFRIDALYVDKSEKNVYVADMNKRCVFIYDLQGNVINKVNINDYFFNDFIKMDDKYWIHSVSEFNNAGSFALRLVDDSFNNTLAGFLPQNNFFVSVWNRSLFFSDNASNYFVYPYNNTIYSLSADSITPFVKIDFGNREIPYKKLNELTSVDEYSSLYNNDYLGNLASYNLCAGQLYFTFSEMKNSKAKQYSVCSDIDRQESKVFDSYKVIEPSGMPFNELAFTYPIAFHENYLIYEIRPYNLKEADFNLLRKAGFNINEESNPILFFVRDEAVSSL